MLWCPIKQLILCRSYLRSESANQNVANLSNALYVHPSCTCYIFILPLHIYSIVGFFKGAINTRRAIFLNPHEFGRKSITSPIFDKFSHLKLWSRRNINFSRVAFDWVYQRIGELKQGHFWTTLARQPEVDVLPFWAASLAVFSDKSSVYE